MSDDPTRSQSGSRAAKAICHVYTGHMAGLDAARAFVGALGRGSAQSLDANLLNVADNSDAIRWLRRALLERLGNA